VGAAEAEGNAEPLGGADGDVRPELAGGTQEGESQEVGRHHHQRPRRVGPLRERCVVAHPAVGCGIGHQHAEHVPEVRVLDRAHPHLNAEG
jgi:hypothetical protein